MTAAQITKTSTKRGKWYFYSASGHITSDKCLALSAIEGAIGTYLVNLADDNRKDVHMVMQYGDGKLNLDTFVSNLARYEVQASTLAAYLIIDAGIAHVNFNEDIPLVNLEYGETKDDVIEWRAAHGNLPDNMDIVALSEKRPSEPVIS